MATPSTPAFLKPQDTDAETRPSAGESDSAPEKAAKKSSRWILFAAIGILLIAVAAVCLWFLHRRIRTHRGNASLAIKPLSSATADKESPAAAPVDLPLDPFVVNLADAGGHSYARIGMTLAVTTPEATAAKSEKKDAGTGDSPVSRDMLRDTIIGVLNQEQSSDLLAQGGKEHLKNAIRAAVAARDPKIKIADIFFTEFLIQQ